MTTRRLQGTGVHLVIDGVDYWAEATSVVLDHDGVPVAKASGVPVAPGGVRWWMEIAAVQDMRPASLWSLLWEHEYAEATVIYAPHRNAWPSEDKPFFVAPATLGAAPRLGGDAGRDVDYEYLTRVALHRKPVRVGDPEGLAEYGWTPPDDEERS